ncbi:hypothetical protein CAEBREN_09755 [Caenorhabditis brenneri]|uniref:Uncharacterized protein n=1 Tax=Caenorhabditis brenneri TaxID=135651 RepID=G0MDD1_CAEBE|nr:hypothetical protein CAEBREN_09755 [Caenorhabditis brenneri]
MANNYGKCVTLEGWVDEMNRTQRIHPIRQRSVSPVMDFVEKPEQLTTKGTIEKQRRTIENYSNLVDQFGYKTKTLENRVIDLEYENKEFRDKLKQVYSKEQLAKAKEQKLTDDKENSDFLGAMLEKLGLKDSETKKLFSQGPFNEIDDLHFQIQLLNDQIEKPHYLVKENELLREKVEILEALQQVNPDVSFENSVLKQTVSRVQQELDSTNLQIGMMVGRYEDEKEEMRKEHEKELAEKNKEIEELNATIQLLKEKQW